MPLTVAAAACRAAAALTARLGVRCTEPVVLADGANVVVWLAPSPVVAKVAASTASVRANGAAWLQRELDVVAFLVQAGAPDRVLASLGLADTDEPPTVAAPVRLTQFIWLRSEHGGWWEPTVVAGESVEEGQLLGTLTSLDGAEERQRIVAPTAGLPIFITISPATEPGGLLLGLGAV